jgi:hypothetical protein
MKIAFLCPPVPGHFNPMSAVARPIYRDNSRSIQKAIAKRNGLSVAADRGRCAAIRLAQRFHVLTNVVRGFERADFPVINW